MLPQLRVVLDQFSLVSIKAVCDVTGSRGHGANSRGTGRHGQNFVGMQQEELTISLCKRENTHKKDLKVYQESVSGVGRGNDGGGFPKITGETPQWV